MKSSIIVFFIKKKYTTFLVVIGMFLNFSSLQAQEFLKPKRTKKTAFYTYWGWNFSQYSKSDISFRGPDYSFTLENARATDRQSKFSVDKYLNPANMTIPQYNFRIGMITKNDWEYSLGIDHMKYVLLQNSTATLSGVINTPDTPYKGSYYNDDIVLTSDFLQYEHTDGLNYINFEMRKHHEILSKKAFKMYTVNGFGLGVLFPKTRAQLFNQLLYDDFHISGYGLSGVTALKFTFFKHLLLQFEIKAGFINMPDIRTGSYSNHKASQKFWFLQENMVLGYTFTLD